MKRVRVVFPTAWDVRQLTAAPQPYEVAFDEPGDADCPLDFDVLAYIDRVAAEARTGAFQGVMSSSDYPGATVAAAIATAAGLPGPRPDAVLRASHKHASRLVQARAAPEAVPRFWLLDARRPRDLPPGLPFPCFVKPVKGAFSVLARRVDSARELRAFLTSPAVVSFTQGYMRIFDRLMARYAPEVEVAGSGFIVEELVGGRPVTLEGFARGGEVSVLGVVDSIHHPGTNSFARFDYRSALPDAVKARLRDVAARVVAALGLDDTLFNLEMTWDEASDVVRIVEVNPRMCGQFADLYAKVDGTHGYALALALAAGDPPDYRPNAGPDACAASVPLRIFEPVRCVRAPGPDDVRAAEALFPGALVWTECEAGQELSDFAAEDGRSIRYAVINLGAPDRATLLRRADEVAARLGYRFEPLG